MIKDYLQTVFSEALKKIEAPEGTTVSFEAPKNPEHGDYAFTGAMGLARLLKKQPRMIAEDIIKVLEFDTDIITSVDIAGPGFINVKVSSDSYAKVLENIIKEKENFGKTKVYQGKKVIVEYVSVNPTGLLHLGHGRNACIGDTLANIYKWRGADITREYYFNNAGNQMNNLAKSVFARYMQKNIDSNFEFPEDGYHGDYIRTIADGVFESYGDALKEGDYQDLTKCRKFGESWCFEQIKATLIRLNISQDQYYNEDSLYKEGKINAVIDELTEMGLVYEKEDAKWLKLSEMGLEDDRVIVKSSGEPTYRLPDIAYHREKFRRGFDEMIDVFGADHIATVPDVLASIKALGYDSEKVKVVIHQFVTLMESGKQVKMSKRTGKSFTLDDLLDEVGADVVRFFLIMRGISTHLEFDLDLARQQSDKNPVYYLQYAHARCSSILKKIDIDMAELYNDLNTIKLDVLNSKDEVNLIKQIMRFPDVINLAGDKLEPQVVAEYLKEVAAAFHSFYHNCHIIGEEENLMKARLLLTNTARLVIRNGLTVLGISVPETM